MFGRRWRRKLGPGEEALQREERRRQREERRKKRRERIALLLGLFTGTAFGTRKIGLILSAAVAVIVGVLIWKIM